MTYLRLDIVSRAIQINDAIDKSLGCQPGEKLLCVSVAET